jgi:hypothetical protein
MMRKASKMANARKSRDSLHIAKNPGEISAKPGSPDLLPRIVKCRRDLGELHLKTREKTHEILARLYMLAHELWGSKKAYKAFASDRFFKSYAKKKPRRSDGRKAIMSNLLRFAYNVSSSDSSGYHAARRYARILLGLAEEGCSGNQVLEKLRRKDANARYDVQPTSKRKGEGEAGISCPATVAGRGKPSGKGSSQEKDSTSKKAKALKASVSKEAIKSKAKTPGANRDGPELNVDYYQLFPDEKHARALAKASRKKGTLVWILVEAGRDGAFHTRCLRKPQKERRTAQ